MGLPSINIAFSSLAASAVQRSQKGIVAIIIKDAAENGAHSLSKASEIPAALSASNRAYIERAFTGYIVPPKKVIVFVQAAASTDLTTGLGYFETIINSIDYLVGPPDTDATMAAAIATWVQSMRADAFTIKAVLPDYVANSDAVINFAADNIVVGATTFTSAQYCSRIAGLIAGTPMTISCTYAPLPEITSVDRLTKDELDAAIDAGKFVLYHDGAKVKVGRGVNSLTTTTESKGAAFKKIKIVETIDMIRKDIRMTAEDSYIGKYANDYDNKLLLVTAIKAYLTGLETSGILATGTSVVEIDIDAQEAYLKSVGIDTSDMTEQELKEANTGSEVYFKAKISILDAIEDITLAITI